MNDAVDAPGHAYFSYVREDSADVDRLQRVLEAAGIPIWRGRDDIWPGEDWRIRVRQAITRDALAFIACFSANSTRHNFSRQNEELMLAIDQLRQRPAEFPWLFPVRLDECEIPEVGLGYGRTLASIQRADLFGDHREEGIARLVASVLRVVGPRREIDRSSHYSCFLSYSAHDADFVTKLAGDLVNAGINCWLDTQDLQVGASLEREIYRGLSTRDKLLLVLSRSSVQSRWVDSELRMALSLEQERGNEVIFPIRLDRSVFDSSSHLLDDLVKTRHIGDFEGWQDETVYHRHLKQLVRDLTFSAAIDSEQGR